MILHKRKGMALITVVLIAALFLISIIGISAKVISEKKVSNARASSERALVTAETGFSQTLFDMRNVDMTEAQPMQPPGVDHYLTEAKIRAIAMHTVGDITDCGEQEYPLGSTDTPYVTYHTKIKRLSGSGSYDTTWDPKDNNPPNDNYDARDIPVQIYSLGTVYSDSTKAEVLARRIVTTECSVVYSKDSTTSEGSSEVFNYGLFSGGDISFGGGAQEVDGDIYAGGNIDLGASPAKVRVNGGTAYAAGQVMNKGQATGGKVSGADEIPFPELDVDYYKDLAHKFKTGDAPYNGSIVNIYDPDDPTTIIATHIQIQPTQLLQQLFNLILVQMIRAIP